MKSKAQLERIRELFPLTEDGYEEVLRGRVWEKVLPGTRIYKVRVEITPSEIHYRLRCEVRIAHWNEDGNPWLLGVAEAEGIVNKGEVLYFVKLALIRSMDDIEDLKVDIKNYLEGIKR